MGWKNASAIPQNDQHLWSRGYNLLSQAIPVCSAFPKWDEGHPQEDSHQCWTSFHHELPCMNLPSPGLLASMLRKKPTNSTGVAAKYMIPWGPAWNNVTRARCFHAATKDAQFRQNMNNLICWLMRGPEVLNTSPLWVKLRSKNSTASVPASLSQAVRWCWLQPGPDEKIWVMPGGRFSAPFFGSLNQPKVSAICSKRITWSQDNRCNLQHTGWLKD